MRSEVTGQPRSNPYSRVRGALRSVCLGIISTSVDRREAAERARRSALRASVQEREADLLEFYAGYESLVETLCAAAQLGATENLDKKYTAERLRLRTLYPGVRHYIVAFLQFSVDDTAQCIAIHGCGGDAFEALTEADDLAEFLRIDDGSMISRIDRTREAISRYREHLRWLRASVDAA